MTISRLALASALFSGWLATGQVCAAPATGAAVEIKACTPAELLSADMRNVTTSDGAKLCSMLKDTVTFPVTDLDLQRLAMTAVDIVKAVSRSGRNIYPADAAAQVMEIVKLRNQTADETAFIDTVYLVDSIADTSDGKVSPAVLIARLRGMGAVKAAALSDNGITNLASMLLMKAGPPSDARDGNSDFAETMGGWDITGLLSPKGNLVACRMERPAGNGTFFYSFMLSDRDTSPIEQYFGFPTDFEEAPSAEVEMRFDEGVPFTLNGSVEDKVMTAALPKDAAVKRTLLDRFRSAARVSWVITVSGRKSSAPAGIGIAGSGDVFSWNSICAKGPPPISEDK